jgi:hypothetical protein
LIPPEVPERYRKGMEPSRGEDTVARRYGDGRHPLRLFFLALAGFVVGLLPLFVLGSLLLQLRGCVAAREDVTAVASQEGIPNSEQQRRSSENTGVVESSGIAEAIVSDEESTAVADAGAGPELGIDDMPVVDSFESEASLSNSPESEKTNSTQGKSDKPTREERIENHGPRVRQFGVTDQVDTGESGPRESGFRDIFDSRVAREGGSSGELQVTLIWENYNDLDLHVGTPRGEKIWFRNERSRCGGILDVDMNAGGRFTNQPVENITWGRTRAPAGKYRIGVVHYASHGSRNPTPYRIRIVFDGKTLELDGVIGPTQRRLVKIIDKQ